MSDLTTTVQRVLDLDKQATPGPWTPQMMEGIDGDTLSAAGPEHAITDDENDDERDNSSDAALADARLIAEYRTAAPVLARAVTALEAKLAAAVARGCCDACAGAGGDPDCMCGGSGSAADAVVHLRNEYFAARAELQAAVARADAATKRAIEQERLRIEEFDYLCDGRIKDDDIRLALVTSNRERDALRADLARVTAERDRARAMEAHNMKELVLTAKALTDEINDLAEARREAEGLRARLTALDKHTFDQDDDNAPLYVLRDEMLAALSSPAPVPEATPVSAIHNVGKPCPVCSGCDVCLGTGRAPHYVPAPVPAPVPATPAPDAVAVLREVMGWIDNWTTPFTEDDEWPATRERVLAALAGRA